MVSRGAPARPASRGHSARLPQALSASDSLLPGRGFLLGGKQNQLHSTQQEMEAQVREGPCPRSQSHRVSGSLETRAQDLTPRPALPLPLQRPWPTRRDPQPSEVHQTLPWVAVTVLDGGGAGAGATSAGDRGDWT